MCKEVRTQTCRVSIREKNSNTPTQRSSEHCLIRYKDLWPEQAPCWDCSPKISSDQLFCFVFHGLVSMILHDTCRHGPCIPLAHLKGWPPFFHVMKSIKWCTGKHVHEHNLRFSQCFSLGEIPSTFSSCAPTTASPWFWPVLLSLYLTCTKHKHHGCSHSQGFLCTHRMP